MQTANENSQETSNPVRILAAAVFLVMVTSGYAISTHVEGAADQVMMAIPPIPPADQAQNYFPAQFAKQAASSAELNERQAAGEDIPTF